jgi:hypothetical protein
MARRATIQHFLLSVLGSYEAIRHTFGAAESRQERDFWGQRPGVEIALLPRAETGTVQGGEEKPRQWRAFPDSLRKTPKQRTGWWRMQSERNRSPRTNSLLSGKLTGNFRFLPLLRPNSTQEAAVSQGLCV